MPSDDSFEAFWGVSNVVDHGKFDVAVSDNIGVGFILLLALQGALLMLKARLVEVDVLAHDDGLDADEHLQEGGDFGVPVFHGRAAPGAEQAEADLAAGVQVGIESDLCVSCGGEVDLRGAAGVGVFEVNVEKVGAVAVGSAIGAHD